MVACHGRVNSLARPHTGTGKEQERKMVGRGCVLCEKKRSTHIYTPLHHYLMSPTRLQEQPHQLSGNWSRRDSSLKYLVTKRAVENIVGGEHTHMYTTTTKKKTQYTCEMREGENSFLALEDQSSGVLLLSLGKHLQQLLDPHGTKTFSLKL